MQLLLIDAFIGVIRPSINDIVRVVCYIKHSLLLLIMQKQKRMFVHALINPIAIGYLKSTCLTVPSSARWIFILLYYQLLISYARIYRRRYSPVGIIILRRHRPRL